MAIDSKPRTALRTHLILLLLIASATLLPRALTIARTVAPARDAFRYIRAAETFDRLPFADAVRAIDVHPLYPLSLRAAYHVYAWATGTAGPFAWLYAGQIGSTLSYLLFMFAAYAAGVLLWNPRIAALGCIAIAIVPRQVWYSSDLLADSLHAAMWMASFACLAAGMKFRKARPFCAAGLLAGLAYWTRPEAILVPALFIASLGVLTLVRRWNWSFKAIALSSVAFFAPYLLLLGSYYWIAGTLSPRQSVRAVMNLPTVPEPRVTLPDAITEIAGADVSRFRPDPAPAPMAEPIGESVNLLPKPFNGTEGYDKPTVLEAVARLLWEYAQETRVWPLIFVLIALIDRRRTQCRMPGGLLVFFALAGCSAMLVLLQIKAGYIAGRYMTPVLPLLAMYAITGVEAFIARIRAIQRFSFEQLVPIERIAAARTRLAIGSITLMAAAICIPEWFKPLHLHRYGHMQAADWLRRHSAPDQLIFDPTAFASFFAGRRVWLPQPAPPPSLPAQYAVIDPAMIYRTDNFTHQAIAQVNQRGRLVAKFPRKPHGTEVGVYVFQIPAHEAAQNRPEGKLR